MTIFADTMKIMRQNEARRGFPGPFDARCRHGALFPAFRSKFKFNFGPRLSVFTMGSCFSRTTEDALAPLGVRLPALRFTAPEAETLLRPRHLLDDLNPGTIAQRVTAALSGGAFADVTLIPAGRLVSDLLLPGEGLVTLERAVERRAEIGGVYAQLAACKLVIITLGTSETWFDKVNETYLNRMPPIDFARNRPGRFVFLTLEVLDAFKLLEKPVRALGEAGVKVVLAVSPAPQALTYRGTDAVMANEYAKSVLRVCAGRLARKFAHVDYFPAYEIVRWAGLAGLDDNHVHPSEAMNRELGAYFIASYARPADADQAAAKPSLPARARVV